MAKTERFTDKMNVALERVSAAASITSTIVKELPDSEEKRQILKGCEEIERGAKDAFINYTNIRKALESI